AWLAGRGGRVAAETIRRWLHALGWVWKRGKLAAKDEDPQRVEKLARIRYTIEHLPARAALFFADELAISLLPKVGSQWMPHGEQLEVPTPGTNAKRYLAGAWDMQSGRIIHRVWWRKTQGLFLDLLATLDRAYPPVPFTRLDVVVDNYKIHKAQAVAQWLAAHPRFALLFLPTDYPQASLIERAFGDGHDKCTRNHKRKRLWALVRDVAEHWRSMGPGRTSFPTSITLPRLRRPYTRWLGRPAHRKNVHNLQSECTNRVYPK